MPVRPNTARVKHLLFDVEKAAKEVSCGVQRISPVRIKSDDFGKYTGNRI